MTTGVFNLRLPEQLREGLKESADRRGVSLNAEMVRRLELSFEMEEREASMRRHIDQLSEQIADMQRRMNAQHDVMLQFFTGQLEVVPKNRPKRENAA
jgi:hypothetical protein